MKTINLSLILLLAVLFASAQNDDKGNVREEFKLIKMPKFPIADFPKKSIKVSGIQVIQMVRDSVKLGYVLKGLDNQVVQMKTSKPLTDLLQEQINRMYKNDYHNDGAAILLVLKELRVGEKTAFMEYAYTRFDAEAYISTDAVHYQLATSIDTIFVRSSGGDVTAWHGEDIQEALRLLVNETLKNAKAQTVLPAAVTIEEIRELKKQKTDIPILTATAYNEGAYANFQEFLENRPSITSFSTVAVDKKKLKFIFMNSNNQADTLSIWGLCKNGEIFKYHEDAVIPIEKYGNGFIISNYVALANRRNGNKAFGAFVGGIAGALISSATSGKALLVKSIPYITKRDRQPEASCIDMETGEFTF